MGIGNQIKQQEQSHNSGVDIQGYFDRAQATLSQAREEVQDEVRDMRHAVNTVTNAARQTAENQKVIEETTTAFKQDVADARKSLKEDLDRALGKINGLEVDPEYVQQVQEAKSELYQAQKQFRESAQKTVDKTKKQLEDDVKQIQDKFHGTARWIGYASVRDLIGHSFAFYVGVLGALVFAVATGVSLYIAIPKYVDWATTTPWFGWIVVGAMAVITVLSLGVVGKYLWEVITDDDD